MDGSDYSYGGMDSGVLVETRITFNGGGKWSSIKAPTTFNSQKCNRCVGGQSRHGTACWWVEGRVEQQESCSDVQLPEVQQVRGQGEEGMAQRGVWVRGKWSSRNAAATFSSQKCNRCVGGRGWDGTGWCVGEG